MPILAEALSHGIKAGGFEAQGSIAAINRGRTRGLIKWVHLGFHMNRRLRWQTARGSAITFNVQSLSYIPIFFSPRSSSFVTGATRHLLDKNTLSNTMLKQVFSIRAVSGPRCRLAENLAANGRSPQDTLSWRNWKPGSFTGATSHLGQKRNRSISRQQKSTIHTGTSSHLRRPQNRLIWRQWNWRITYCGVELFVQFRPNAGLAM